MIITYNNGREEVRSYLNTDEICKKLLKKKTVVRFSDQIKEVCNLQKELFGKWMYQDVVKEMHEDYHTYVKSVKRRKVKASDFVDKRIDALFKYTYDEFVREIRKWLICALSDEEDNDVFVESLLKEFNFLQPVKDSYDAFVLRQTKDAIMVDEVEHFIQLRRENEYRKVVFIFTSNLDENAHSYIESNEIVLWDLNFIKQLVYKCYIKIFEGMLKE